MKKYDFTKYELWFSFRSLQMLACAERNSFKRHIKRVWRSVDDDVVNWKQEEIYLSRKEGIRDIKRVTEIFDLDTSYVIMADYRRNIPPKFQEILNRLRELQAQSREGYANSLRDSLKRQGMLYDFMNEKDFADNELLEVLSTFKPQKKEKRKRIILDYRSGTFKIVPEFPVITDRERRRVIIGKRRPNIR